MLLRQFPRLLREQGSFAVRLLFESYSWLLSGDALPEAGGEQGVAVAGEVLPLGVEGLELCGGHGGVFCRVETATELEDHVGKTLDEREALAGFDGEVQCESDAGFGEAHHAG